MSCGANLFIIAFICSFFHSFIRSLILQITIECLVNDQGMFRVLRTQLSPHRPHPCTHGAYRPVEKDRLKTETNAKQDYFRWQNSYVENKTALWSCIA